MVYTSYFANWRNFPANSIAVSITRFPPKNWTGLEIKSLAPSEKLLRQFKNGDIDKKVFAWQYIQELQENGITRKVLNDFFAAIGCDIVLCCYEKPEDFCHRHILASWYGNGEINELSK